MFEGLTDIFFDLDHTLWDFESNSALTFEKILGENQLLVDLNLFMGVYSPINIEMWKCYRENGIGAAQLRYQRIRRTFDALQMEVGDPMIHRLSSQYMEHLPSFSRLLPNALEILDYLQPKYKMHIITNGFEKVQLRKLKSSGLDRYFDKLVNAEMAGVKKPDPLIFGMALEMAKADPRKSLMVGDNLEADIMGAKQLDMHLLHFNSNGEPQHDICRTIYDLIEIKSLL